MVIRPPKIKILETLKTPRSLGELSKAAEKSKQALLFHLKPLLELGLVRKLEGEKVRYQTSELGSLVLKLNTRLRKLEGVIITAGKFFSEHDLAAIPREVFEEVYMLDGCRVITKANPYEVHSELERILTESRWVKGLSSVYHERFPGLFVEIADAKSVELILTEDVFSVLVERAETKLSEYLRRRKMYVCGNVRLAFVVAERGLAMGLYWLNGVYDAQNILACRMEDAVRWGLELFEYYKLRSREVKQSL